MRELRTTDKLIVTVATTGGFQGKEANPNLPLQPEEIAQSAYEAWNEGASIVHIHARARETNAPTSDPEVLCEIDQRIREKKCDIIINKLIHQVRVVVHTLVNINLAVFCVVLIIPFLN